MNSRERCWDDEEEEKNSKIILCNFIIFEFLIFIHALRSCVTHRSFAQLSSSTSKSKKHIDTLEHPSTTQRIWEFSLSTLTLLPREFNQYWRAFKAKRRGNCMSINSNWHEIGEYKSPCLEKFSFYFAKHLRKWKLKNRCAGLERETTKNQQHFC